MTQEEKQKIIKLEKVISDEIKKLDKLFKSDITSYDNIQLFEERILLKSFLIECKKVNEFYKNN